MYYDWDSVPFNILCILKDIVFSLYYRAFLNNMDFMFLLV